MGTALRRVLAVAIATTAALATAACGGTSGPSGAPAQTIDVNVGTEEPVKLSTGPLKVGIFMNAMSNQWQQNLANTAKATAESFGWTAEIVEFNFDQQKMNDALLTASTQHTYDAIAIVPISGQQTCRFATELLPRNNVLTVTAGIPVCGRDLKEGNEMWSPGTYSHNSVTPSVDYDKLFMDKSIAMLPGPQKVAIVVGPEENGTTIVLRQLAKDLAASHPDFQITDFINTDFTTPTTFTAVQSYLQAHRDTTALLSVYSPDLSRGIVQAIQSLGLQGKIAVTEMGGSQYSVEQIKAGTIAMSLPYYPKADGKRMIESIRAAQSGAPDPVRVEDTVPGGLANIPVVTKDNVASFTAEY